MARRNGRDERETRTQPARDERERQERTSALPIEREHETYAGVFDEDERREHDD